MSKTLLQTHSVSKSYGDISVVENIDLEIGYNEIVGIAGENGAGKSTILKLISGVVPPTTGTMSLGGQAYHPSNYREAESSGVFMVFQEQALIGNLRVYENIFFGFEDRFLKFGAILDQKKMRNQAREKLKTLGFHHIDETAVTDTLPFHTRQMVEIARAFILADYLGITHPLILLDEPTAAIGEQEVKVLFDQIRRLRNKASFVIVTHKLSEYIALCDRVYVFKDGAVAGSLSAPGIQTTEVHEMMVGRKRDAALYHEEAQRDAFGESRLSVSKLAGSTLKPLGFEVRSGEVLGIGGLIGSGKEDIVRAIVGHAPFARNGEIRLNGQLLPLKNRSPVAKSLGLGYVPKERKSDGIIGYMSVAKNISLPALDRVSGFMRLISPTKETTQANTFIDQLSIKTRGAGQDAVYLSGGNQQKLVLAKWLARGINVMVLDNPTRGVDIGAKSEIYRIIRDLAQSGVSILLVTDDLLELIGLSNRIIIMREGGISSEIDAPARAKPTETDIVRHMT